MRNELADMPSLNVLAGSAVGLWFGGVGLYFAITERYQYKFRHSEFVKEPLRVLKEYPHVDRLLGQGIRQLRFDLGDDFNKKNDDFAQVVIPVVGTQNKGKMYSWCSRQIKENGTGHYWRVDRLDLMLHNREPFTFYKHPEAAYVEKIQLKDSDLIRNR